MLSMLSVNYYVPEYLNADVILNSIMSLQNVTLFYWGQNRLINIIPFLLQIVNNPTINLATHLLLFSYVYFWLIWELSSFIEMLSEKKSL